MKKMMTAAVVGLSAIVALSGCGRAKTVERKKLEDFQKITSVPAESFTSFKKVNAMTDLASLVLEADADPADTTERHTAETTAKIYSKNTTNSAVIGEFKDEDEVLVLEKLTGTNWYKIVYNGRVAYVQATVLEVKTDSAGSYNNYIGYSDDIEDFDEAAAHSGETADDHADEPGEGGSDPADEPGEGGSEPADEPGEGGSEPASDPGEGGSEPASDPGEGGSEPADDPGEGGSEPADDPGEGGSSTGGDTGGDTGSDAGGEAGDDGSGSDEG